MNKTSENIKMAYIETYDGKCEEFSAARNQFISFFWLPIDMFTINKNLTITENFVDVKKLYIYDGLVDFLGTDKVVLRYDMGLIEDIRLPNGLRGFDCTPALNIRVNELHIPQSLERLRCFNDMKVIGLDEKLNNNEMKEVLMENREGRTSFPFWT